MSNLCVIIYFTRTQHNIMYWSFVAINLYIIIIIWIGNKYFHTAALTIHTHTLTSALLLFIIIFQYFIPRFNPDRNGDVPTPLILPMLGRSAHITGETATTLAVRLVSHTSISRPPPPLPMILPLTCRPRAHPRWDKPPKF